MGAIRPHRRGERRSAPSSTSTSSPDDRNRPATKRVARPGPTDALTGAAAAQEIEHGAGADGGGARHPQEDRVALGVDAALLEAGVPRPDGTERVDLAGDRAGARGEEAAAGEEQRARAIGGEAGDAQPASRRGGAGRTTASTGGGGAGGGAASSASARSSEAT
jgi:hypothetical protein